MRVIGSLEIDTLAKRVVCANQVVPVTATEFAILDALSEHPGWIVSPSDLGANVCDAEPFSNTVAAHIANLRRKFRATGAEEYIETVRGMGYRLRCPDSVEYVSPVPAAPPTLAGDSGLVGKDAALMEILNALDAVAGGGCRTIMVTGPPGYGRSRLLRETASRARARAMIDLMVACSPAAPWKAIRRAITLRDGAPDDESRRASGGDPDEREFVASAARLRALSERSPVALLLDDVHRLDEVELERLGSFLFGLADTRLLCVLTVESGRGVSHALSGYADSVVSLNDLSVQDIRDLLEYSGVSLDTVDAAVVHEVTHGCPSLVHQVAVSLNSAPSPPAFTFREVLDRLATPEMRTRTRMEIARQSTSSLQVLEWVAVAGPDARRDVLLALAQEGRFAWNDSLEEAIYSGVLRWAPNGTLDFQNPFVRHQLYTRLPAEERRVLHAGIARVLGMSERARDALSLERLAHHNLESGAEARVTLAAELACEAARRALRGDGYRHAAEISRRWMERLAPVRDAEVQGARAVLSHALGDALFRLEGPEPAVYAYEEGMCIPACKASTRIALLTGATRSLIEMGRLKEAEAQLAEARSMVQAHRAAISGDTNKLAVIGSLAVEEMRLAACRGETPSAKSLSYVAALGREQSPSARMLYHRTLMWDRLRQDRFACTDETLRHAAEQRFAALESGSSADRGEGDLLYGMALLLQGDLVSARPHLENAVRLSRAIQDRRCRSFAEDYLLLADRLESRVMEVRESAERRLMDTRSSHDGVERAAPLAHLAWSNGRLQDGDDLQVQAREALCQWESVGHFPFKWWAAGPLFAQSVATGDSRTADECAGLMMDKNQQALPESLKAALRDVAAADAESADADDARRKASRIASSLGYA